MGKRFKLAIALPNADNHLDEPMTDAPAKTPAAVTPEPAADESDAKSEPQKKEEPEEKVIVAGGRRRGRRRVMKKKTVQDEEGYLGMFASTTSLQFKTDIIGSDTRRTRLGVLLGGGTRAQEGQGGRCTPCCEEQEGCPQGSRKHHVFLLQEMTRVQPDSASDEVHQHARSPRFIIPLCIQSISVRCIDHHNPHPVLLLTCLTCYRAPPETMRA